MIDPTVQAAIDALVAAATAEEAIDEADAAASAATIASLNDQLSAALNERDTLQALVDNEVAFLTAQRDALDARITALGG